MKRSIVVLVLSGGLLVVGACSSEDSDGSPSPTPDAAAPDTPPPSDSGAGSLEGVECAHPGAGKALGDDRCECTTTRAIAGEWRTMRTCREGDLCPTKNKEEIVVFTQEGTTVHADRGDTYSLSGTLCGDFLVWNGGPKDGLNPECGRIHFLDDSNYVTDSCYVASGECARTFDEGCPSAKGQCTGTGTKNDAPTPIQKVICTE